MEDNNKLFVFEKKEVMLIFIFIILVAVISFTLGVRTGKQLSLKSDEYTSEDINNINLKSVDEEFVEDVVRKNDPNTEDTSGFEKSLEENTPMTAPAKGNVDVMEERLKQEMEKLASEKIEIATPSAKEMQDSNSVNESNSNNSAIDSVQAGTKDYSGKYTIQLFSHQSQESAQEFADGFIMKGYDVIINEVIIPGKGKWYRVRIGDFATVNKAEDYLAREKSLFQSQKYIIQKI